MNDSYWQDKLQHTYEHALLFIFDTDPQFDKIEAVKTEVQAMSTAAQERNSKKHSKAKKVPTKKKFDEDEEKKDISAEDEEAEAPSSFSSNASDNEKNNEPEEPFSSMGCKFNPEDFKKLKLEDDQTEK